MNCLFSNWHIFSWFCAWLYCCCWLYCCWPWLTTSCWPPWSPPLQYYKIHNYHRIPLPPITLPTTWWATALPAPKAIPWARTPPNPLNIPPLLGGACVGAACCCLIGAWVWLVLLGGGLLLPPLLPPPRECEYRKGCKLTSWHFLLWEFVKFFKKNYRIFILEYERIYTRCFERYLF